MVLIPAARHFCNISIRLRSWRSVTSPASNSSYLTKSKKGERGEEGGRVDTLFSVKLEGKLSYYCTIRDPLWAFAYLAVGSGRGKEKKGGKKKKRG
jgi:hypothetical protein